MTKHCRYIFLILLAIINLSGTGLAQIQKEYLKLEINGAEIPVLIRGNIASGKLLLYVQGGPGENAIDFARSDYPLWKNSLEKKVAIAYYDQRGLNERVKNIDSSSITYARYGQDIYAIAETLKRAFDVSIYLLGHSAGGYMIYNCLSELDDPKRVITGAIVMNTPLTTDFSPERYRDYRPLYLKNLAREKMVKNEDSSYWYQAFRWMQITDSIHSPETSAQWNEYVEAAFTPVSRHVGFFPAMSAILSRPYGLFSYPYRKDNHLVSDLLWEDERRLKVHALLQNIDHPVLILTGRYDDIAPPEEIITTQSLIKNSEYAIIPDAGHESYLDNPDVVNAEILRFMGIDE